MALFGYIYWTRFQLELAFRDAEQFTGLTHSQARNTEALSFAPVYNFIYLTSYYKSERIPHLIRI